MGYGAPSQSYPLGALRLPRIARNRGSLHGPSALHVEIKLTFEMHCQMLWSGAATGLSRAAMTSPKFWLMGERRPVRP